MRRTNLFDVGCLKIDRCKNTQVLWKSFAFFTNSIYLSTEKSITIFITTVVPSQLVPVRMDKCVLFSEINLSFCFAKLSW